jgi:hypothetical protein
MSDALKTDTSCFGSLHREGSKFETGILDNNWGGQLPSGEGTLNENNSKFKIQNSKLKNIYEVRNLGILKTSTKLSMKQLI